MTRVALEIIEVADRRCFEVVQFGIGAQLVQRSTAPQNSPPCADWPTSPGAVRWGNDGRPAALHFAPGRWLLPDPSDEILAALSSWPGVTLVDVEGKWQRRSLRGSDAMRLLQAGADVEAMLADRDCAALSLFDCPVIVARSGSEILLWVQSSYAQFLGERLEHALATSARAG